MSKENFIFLDAVTKNYIEPNSGLNFQVLRGIDLKLEEGSFVSIIGPSGSGKSTLMNIISGMIQPTTGKAIINNQVLNAMNQDELAEYRLNTVGYLWQLPKDNLFMSLSIKENLKYRMFMNDITREEQQKRITELAKRLELDQRLDFQCNKLSGGEAQRAGLAVALINQPKVLLADEPTGELDVETGNQIIEYLHEVNQNGITVLVVTHDYSLEGKTNQSFQIIDGTIGTVKLFKHSKELQSVSLINQFGMVKIPPEFVKDFDNRLVRFVKEKGRLYLDPVEDTNESN